MSQNQPFFNGVPNDSSSILSHSVEDVFRKNEEAFRKIKMAKLRGKISISFSMTQEVHDKMEYISRKRKVSVVRMFLREINYIISHDKIEEMSPLHMLVFERGKEVANGIRTEDETTPERIEEEFRAYMIRLKENDYKEDKSMGNQTFKSTFTIDVLSNKKIDYYCEKYGLKRNRVINDILDKIIELEEKKNGKIFIDKTTGKAYQKKVQQSDETEENV